MKKSTVITTFIQELAVMLDLGISHSIEEVEKHIEKGTLFKWLENETYSEKDIQPAFTMLLDSHKQYLNDELLSMYISYAGRESDKYGIRNNGICLLVTWSIDILNNIDPKKSVIE